MKVLLTIEFPDTMIAESGFTPEQALKQFQDLRDELQEGTPPGATVELEVVTD